MEFAFLYFVLNVNEQHKASVMYSEAVKTVQTNVTFILFSIEYLYKNYEGEFSKNFKSKV